MKTLKSKFEANPQADKPIWIFICLSNDNLNDALRENYENSVL